MNTLTSQLPSSSIFSTRVSRRVAILKDFGAQIVWGFAVSHSRLLSTYMHQLATWQKGRESRRVAAPREIGAGQVTGRDAQPLPDQLRCRGADRDAESGHERGCGGDRHVNHSPQQPFEAILGIDCLTC